MDQFVCVRAVQMYGVDLSRFQFQPMLTWSVMFLNADGTIYGRYGSRGARRSMAENDEDVSLEGFTQALEGALELHAAYPANLAALAGKSGPKPLAPSPERLPLAPPDQAQPVRPGRHNCVHCHQVQDWTLMAIWHAGEPVPDRLLWSWPMPDQVGMTLDVREKATVSAVARQSPAAQAGFRAGDRIVELTGQPILSIADVQWVLENADEPSTVAAKVERSGRPVELELALPRGWRRSGNFADTQSVGWTLRLFVAGMRTSPLGAGDKRRLGLEPHALALRIDEIAPDGVQRRNRSAREIGLRKGDILTAIDGHTGAMSESEFLGYLVQKKRPGDSVELAYVRHGEAKTVRLRLP